MSPEHLTYPVMGTVASTSDELEMVSMNESIWKLLPEDLIERVLACLPMHSIFRMRCVCKRWYSLLFSERFVAKYSEVSPQKPWIVMYTAGRISSAYNSTLKKWHDLVIPAISPEKCVLAAAEGLLCYGNEFFPWPNLFVCNPLTKFWQHLPPMRFIKTIHVVGMACDRVSRSYKILVAGLYFDDAHNGRLATEIYDSTTNTWTIGGTPWPIMAAAWKLGAGYAVWSQGLFYCITFSPFGVITYNLEKHVWDEVHCKMPSCIVSPSLVECHGRLIMVGGCEEGNFLGIRIWELERTKMVWVEIERMPRKLRREFVDLLRPSRHFFCFGTSNLICLSISESSPAMLYDLDDGSWQWLPNCPRLPDINNWQLRGISFEPRLDAYVEVEVGMSKRSYRKALKVIGVPNRVAMRSLNNNNMDSKGGVKDPASAAKCDSSMEQHHQQMQLSSNMKDEEKIAKCLQENASQQQLILQSLALYLEGELMTRLQNHQELLLEVCERAQPYGSTMPLVESILANLGSTADQPSPC